MRGEVVIQGRRRSMLSVVEMALPALLFVFHPIHAQFRVTITHSVCEKSKILRDFDEA
jgi:hypothetical protein